ncbi:MAG: hypothetical protein COV01_03025 [Candidatus Taylorbacteria bacterium CG10_big_fil_rev_8_21_14_0_10_41_48]|uniref:Glycoside hydrolase family 57 N-terminal domain-containing protein n=1 Tax=Candidatus Taylorbacteria bacterium CG10_big_fil_rev_8_21_14_0_10_41_48 TaxID=1975024 RepID=A0A2M8LBQ3_9BACT|nr:MAG: hypothetical protein COV01_03025 [Candidatus Taylorbacteria bacterium CG10_big_fil_rev_8_21_14_0_10_41_48]
MKWAHFLHIYQPAEQQRDIVEAVVNQSYRPLARHFKDNPHVRLTLNITGSLLELLDKYGYQDVIDDLREAGLNGHIEFTGSAKYHAFLPLLAPDEIDRQIRINNETCEKYLGDAYKPKGFFPPEMAYTPALIPILEKFGFEWIILDEIAYKGKPGVVDFSKLYQIKGSTLKVFFKERRASNVLMSAIARSVNTFFEALKEDMNIDRYLITGMDGETFGHHRPGLELTLFELLKSPKFTFVNISDLLNEKYEVIECSPIQSTWASSQNDIEKGIQFLSWSDPENEIHKMQWRFLSLTSDLVKGLDESNEMYEKVRHLMDVANASDHFWWASAKPWWSLEMIEEGAYKFMEVIRAVPNVPTDILVEAGQLYEGIVSTAFNWQRTGKVREMMKSQYSTTRISFKDRTLGKGGAEEGVYHAFMDMMKNLEIKARDNGEYEKAILWRDAQYKLEHKLDIYDAINAVDLLRVEISNEEVEKTIQEYKDKYRAIRGGQPEQRGS